VIDLVEKLHQRADIGARQRVSAPRHTDRTASVGRRDGHRLGAFAKTVGCLRENNGGL
jgi:hypothetical protein